MWLTSPSAVNWNTNAHFPHVLAVKADVAGGRHLPSRTAHAFGHLDILVLKPLNCQPYSISQSFISSIPTAPPSLVELFDFNTMDTTSALQSVSVL